MMYINATVTLADDEETKNAPKNSGANKWYSLHRLFLININI